MEPEPQSSLDFSFGFNNANYSDRTLLLEIIDDAETEPHEGSNWTSIVKRPTCDDLLIDSALRNFEEPRVKTIHISSLLLAAKSQFFRKLFSNGMRESKQKHVTLRIKALEEVSFMDLLSYVYSNNLPTTSNALFDLLVIADKFEVVSCLRDCARSLQNLPMTYENALLYLDLPPSVLMSPTIQPSIDAAKQFLIAHFKDLDKFMEEVLNLSLAGIQAVVSSDDLQVTSECAVFDLVLAWVRKHYPNLEERRDILKTHLLHLIRFPFITTTKLTDEVQTCSDIDPELAFNLVIRALCFKADTSHRKRCLAEGSTACRQFVERAYKHRPVKVVELELQHQHCIDVYLRLTREELSNIFPEGLIRSESFHLGGQELVLIGRCSLGNQTHIHLFWLALKVVGCADSYRVDYKIELRMKDSYEFESWVKGSHTFTEPESSTKYLHNVKWNGFIAEDSTYFVNDILHVRATIRHEY